MAPERTPRGRGVHETSTLESPLSATWRPRVPERAVLVGVGRGGIEEADLDELAALARLGRRRARRPACSRRAPGPDPATFVGKGKVEEIHEPSTRPARRR